MTLSTFGLTRLPSSRTVWQPHYARRVLITDAVAIVLAMLFAQWVRFGGAGYGPSASMLYTGYSLVLACLWLGVLNLHHARSASILGCGIEEYRRVVAASFWTFGVIAIVALLARLGSHAVTWPWPSHWAPSGCSSAASCGGAGFVPAGMRANA